MPIHTLTLRITTTDGNGLPDALAELVYRDAATTQVLHSGRTDADGYVKLRLGEDAPPHAHLRLTRGAEAPKFLGPEPIWQRGVAFGPPAKAFPNLKLNVLVEYTPPASTDPAPAPATSTSKVTVQDSRPFRTLGRVTHPNGIPVPAARIQLLERDLGADYLLGAKRTDPRGNYLFEYRARTEDCAPDLIVRVLSDQGEVIATSKVVVAAPAECKIDLTVPASFHARPEFDVLTTFTREAQKRAPYESWRPEDVELIAERTGLGRARLARFVRCHALAAEQPGIEPDLLFASLPADPLGDWAALVIRPAQATEAAVRRAVEAGQVAEAVLCRLEEFLGVLARARTEATTLRLSPSQLTLLAQNAHLTRDELAPVSKEAAAEVDRLAGATAAGDTPLRELPFLEKPLAHARLHRAAAVAGLSAASGAALVDALGSIERLDDAQLREAVKGGRITQGEAQALGTTATVLTLTEGSEPVARSLRTLSIRQVAAMTAEDWQATIRRTKAVPPPGKEVDAWGEDLARRMGALRPSVALHGRLLGALAGPRVAMAAKAWPGLGLSEILSDQSLTPTDRTSRIRAAIAPVERLLDRHPDVNWLALDYSPRSKDLERLDLDATLAPAEKKGVLRSFKAQQRMFAAAGDVDIARRLLESGFTTSMEISRLSIKELEDRSGMSRAQASIVHESSDRTAKATSRKHMAVHDALAGGFDKTRVANFAPSVHEFLREIEGLGELFGAQSLCACAHCRSILSPAAYFVDLMRFVDLKVRRTYFGEDNQRDPIDLRNRRPDLWKLPLTCEHTDTLVPTLQIVNEIMENFVAEHLRVTATDRPTIEDAVYRHLYAARANPSTGDIASLAQPFCLPLHEIDRLLTILGQSRASLAGTFGANGERFERALLRLSPRDHELVVTARESEHALLGRLFGVEVPNGFSATAMLDPVEVASLLGATGLDPDSLVALLAVPWIAGTTPPVLRSARRSTDSVQNDVQYLDRLTLRTLDRLHRFMRLSRASGLTTAELNFLIEERDYADLTGNVNEIARIVALRDQLAMPLEEVCALIGDLPTTPAGPGGVALHDRRFNRGDHVGTWPNPGATYPLPGDGLGRLLAGLEVTEPEVRMLLDRLATPLGITNQPEFAVSSENLARLYRHARLARALRLDIASLLKLIPVLIHGAVEIPGDLQHVEAFVLGVERWRRTGRSIDSVRRILGLDPSGAAEAATAVFGESQPAFRFTDSVFATALGVSEQTSRDLVAANLIPGGVIEAIPGGFRLVSSYDPGTSTVHVVAGTSVAQVQEALRPYEALRPHEMASVLPGMVARALGMDQARLDWAIATAMRAFTAPEVAEDILAGGTSPATAGKLAAWLDPVLVLVELVNLRGLDLPALELIRTQPAWFGLDPTRAVTIEAVWDISRYAAFLRAPATEFGEPPELPDRAALRTALDPLPRTSDAENAAFAAFLRTDVDSVTALVGVPPASASTLGTLERVSDGLITAGKLGVSARTLVQALSDSFDELAAAADTLRAVLRRSYPDVATADSQLAPLDSALREVRRDALCEYLVRSWPTHSRRPWDSRSDLYHHFLIDVETGGCTQTSRLLSAISSVQLYVQRVRLDLEQDRRNDGTATRTHVLPGSIPVDEWVWRQNYRLWEANRKVFLYPENYLEPDLRDDKTPLFEELEQTLLQQDITDQTAEDAYGRWLAGFEEVASLQIGGAWYESTDEGVERLHLFGCTPSDPPTWYYRSVDNLIAAISAEPTTDEPTTNARWTPWVKVDAQIPVRKVSPIVIDGRLSLLWVELRTKPVSEFELGTSNFKGYDHRMTYKTSTLRPDGSWTAPQTMNVSDTRSLIPDRNTGPGTRLAIGGEIHPEAVEGYTLRGDGYERALVGVAQYGGWQVRWSNFSSMFGKVDLSRGEIADSVWSDLTNRANRSFYSVEVDERGRMYALRSISSQHLADLMLTEDRIRSYYSYIPGLADAVLDRTHVEERAIGKVPTPCTSLLVGGSHDVTIHQVGPDATLIVGKIGSVPSYRAVRIGTTLGEQVSEGVFVGDAATRLSLQTDLVEKNSSFLLEVRTSVIDDSPPSGSGSMVPYGLYFEELLLHIPWRFAAQLNAQGRYAEAQRWYHYMFDPTASVTEDDLEVAADPEGLLRDRPWRYRGFRGIEDDTLRDILKNVPDAYYHDPFNPHAIARERLTAYQKAVVMRYIDNLLDWGDSLFTRFTSESLNEAALLYSLAAGILGPRPVEVGPCGEGGVSPRDYETIAPLLDTGSDFLAELETIVVSKWAVQGDGGQGLLVISEGELLINSGERRVRVRKPPLRTSPRRSMPDRTAPGTGPSIADGLAGSEIRLMDPGTGLDFGPVVEQYVSLAFCIPPNAELLDYWNRVEDRLFKLRNCMDITGARRRPPLFEPPIDPRMLVRLKAAGLTLDDVLDTTSTLPPYRFTFLLDRARSYATTVQAFGSALLAAIEKKDGLELERLRLTHQQNLATLATSSQRWEVRVAEESLEAVRRQRETIQHRHDHFANLLAGRKNLWEVMQGASVHGASVLRLLAAHLTGTAGALHLIPQVGAPTAMKYGGVELGNSTQAWAAMFRDSAGVLDLVASSTGLEATFARREEGWAHEVDAAELDLRALDKQILAAEFRVEIAKRALQTHEKSIEHTEEVFRLYQDRFTNLGLYSWQVTNLQRLYRGAWQSAWTFARYCEQAYRYERGADGPPLGTGHWDGARAGLLAGESLVLALQELERRFLESNHRGHDVEQRFSLLQLDPGKLLELRATGKCEISVPEFWFDLHYPGHYRRRIKGVRLSIPCVAGPYTNVGAVLTLLSSSVRETATAPALTPDPAGRTQSVATSGAVNDAGVFEFSFRDERYMPFEGAGAAGSSWRLQLPDAFRAFDYDTISDVVLSIAYTAEYDESLRARVEESTELTTARLVSMLETDGIQVLVSLRHSFSEAFTRLLRAPADTDCSFELTEREVPHFLRGRNLGGRNLVVEDAKVKLRLAADLTAEGFELTFDGGVHPLGWTTADDEPPTADVTLGHLHGTHFFTLGGTGSLGPGPGGARVDGSKLLDVLLELHLKLSPLPQPPP